MRFVLVSLLLSSAAQAQLVPPPPDNGCDGFPNVTPPPPPQPGGRSGGDAAVPAGFGSLAVASPPPGTFNAPRNIEIRLVGDVASLDAVPPLFIVELRDASAANVEVVRRGRDMHPAAPLPAQSSFVVHIEASAANPCPECVGVQEVSFTTGDEIDTTPPLVEGDPPVNVFVMPSPAEAAKCGLFFSQTHDIIIDFGPKLPINASVQIVAKQEGGDPTSLIDQINTGQAFPFVVNLGQQLPVALGDEFFFAISARDLAGNTGPARVIRVRARSFIDENKPRDTLAPLWCDMPSEPVLTAAPLLPRNGRIQVDFPFEEIPVSLRDVDGTIIPLVPLEETAGGHVYNTAVPMPANSTLDVIGLDCPHCVCAGCTLFEGAHITVGDVIDNTPPAAPVVRDLREDANPALSVQTQCAPDRPALVVVLEPGKDDVAAPLDLRYDAVIKIEDQPPLAMGTSLVPFARSDGTTILRIETNGFGRVMGKRFELTLTAHDAAGNSASSSTLHDDNKATGCAAASPREAGALVLALGLLARRRRTRAV